MTTSNVDVPISRLHSNPDLPPGDYVRWSVVDSGCGMTSDVLSHLFEPFFTTKPVGVGVGLAMSAVYGIVDRAGGHIFATSEPGRGSTFVIYLPRASQS
jgi:signal transduction histidine kinase